MLTDCHSCGASTAAANRRRQAAATAASGGKRYGAASRKRCGPKAGGYRGDAEGCEADCDDDDDDDDEDDEDDDEEEEDEERYGNETDAFDVMTGRRGVELCTNKMIQIVIVVLVIIMAAW